MSTELRTTPLRIAWTGPVGHEGGPWFATTLLRTLLVGGNQVDLYMRGQAEHLPTPLKQAESLQLVARVDGWRWGRWYSSNMALAFGTSAAARLRTYLGLSRELARRHRAAPYDLVFQLSQPETFRSRRTLQRSYPPIVVHPCTHAAGELRWLRNEADIMRRYESPARRLFARGYLESRARIQRHEIRKPALVIGPSRRFLDLICSDYAVPAELTAVLRHPIDLERFSPGPVERPARPLVLLYVSRLSARKGLDLIAALSHRLSDLAGNVKIEIYGGPTMWSDYTGMLEELNPVVASYEGSLPAVELVERYHSAHALLLPSRYEPGALVVGEALATGMPVVISDEVGPGEVIDPEVCRRFEDGNVDTFERAVRVLLDDLGRNERALRTKAVAEARRLFAPEVIGAELQRLLEGVCNRARVGSPEQSAAG